MEELIKCLERVIATGAPDKDGQHPISAETVLEVVKGLSEHGTNLASLGTDCISRQQAIDALREIYEFISKKEASETTDGVMEILDAVIAVPPAQLSTNLAEVGTDCISRRSAIDALRAMQTYKLFAGDDMLLIDQAGAQTELMLLPPIQPKRGRWISADAMFHGVPFYCSECGENTRDTVMGKPRWGFCPNCGAKMEVNNESN